MKRFLFTIAFMLQLVSPLKATHNEQDSLRVFLEQIGENPATISLIVNSPDAKEPSRVIDNYLSLLRLGYDCNQKKYEWYPGWEDSLYVCKYVDYLTRQIVQDTALSFIENYLVEESLKLFNDEYVIGKILDCAEHSIVCFHSRSGYLIPELYYLNKKTTDWQDKLQFFEMVEFVISNSEKMRYFDIDTNKKINAILTESNESSPHYMQFRSKLNGYSNMELARITNEQELEFVSILLQGIANREKKSQITYAFMLLTGQFVDKDEKLGKELLSGLLE